MTENLLVRTSPAPALPTPRIASSATVTPRPPVDVAGHQLSVALTWVRRGLPVIPCSRTGKAPLVPGFGMDATPSELAPFSDEQQVTEWWTGRYRRAHVGILTRALVVVDLDMLKDGATPPSGRWTGCYGGTDVLELLMRQAGAEWPETYTTLTPSGGMHLYYLQPDGAPIGCATGDGVAGPHLGPLVDVRGVGGLVIAAGSYSASQGRPYARISPPAVGPQPLPAWLLSLLRRPAPARPRTAPAVRALPPGDRAERAANAALQSAAAKVVDAPEGERNRALFSAARWLGEISASAPAVLGESAVVEQLLTAALSSGQSESEARRTIRSGWERGTQAGNGAGAA